jgi:phasin
MAEAKKTVKVAALPLAQAGESVKSQFEKSFAQFDVPRIEVPAAYRDLVEKGISQAKQNYERLKTVTEEASELVETTYATATRGASEYGVKLLEALRANANAHFDFAQNLLAVKSPSEMVELSTTHARKQFETLSAQSKELASLAQKVSTETAEPIKAGFSKAFNAVA